MIQTCSISTFSRQVKYWCSWAQGNLIPDFCLTAWNNLVEFGSPLATIGSLYVNPTYNNSYMCKLVISGLEITIGNIAYLVDHNNFIVWLTKPNLMIIFRQ